MSARTVYLTIKGETQSMAAWSRVPGAAKYNTIADRVLRLHRDHETAVFGPSMQGKVKRGEGRSRGRDDRHHSAIPKREPLAPAGKFELGQLLRWGGCVSVTFRSAA